MRGRLRRKKELLFSDDCELAELGKAWAIVAPTFSNEKGARKEGRRCGSRGMETGEAQD